MKKVRRHRELDWLLPLGAERFIATLGLQPVVNAILRYTFIGEYFERIVREVTDDGVARQSGQVIRP